MQRWFFLVAVLFAILAQQATAQEAGKPIRLLAEAEDFTVE